MLQFISAFYLFFFIQKKRYKYAFSTLLNIFFVGKLVMPFNKMLELK